MGSPFGRWGSASGHVRLEGKGMARLSLISHVIWWQILQQRVRLLVASVTVGIRIMDSFILPDISVHGRCLSNLWADYRIFLYEPSPKVLEMSSTWLCLSALHTESHSGQCLSLDYRVGKSCNC